MPTPDEGHPGERKEEDGSKSNGHNSQYSEDQPKEKSESAEESDCDMNETVTETTSLLSSQEIDQERRDASFLDRRITNYEESLPTGTQETDESGTTEDMQLANEVRESGISDPSLGIQTSQEDSRPAGAQATDQNITSVVTHPTEDDRKAEGSLVTETTEVDRRDATTQTSNRNGTPEDDQLTDRGRRIASTQTNDQNTIPENPQLADEGRSACIQTNGLNRVPEHRQLTDEETRNASIQTSNRNGTPVDGQSTNEGTNVPSRETSDQNAIPENPQLADEGRRPVSIQTSGLNTVPEHRVTDEETRNATTLTSNRNGTPVDGQLTNEGTNIPSRETNDQNAIPENPLLADTVTEHRQLTGEEMRNTSTQTSNRNGTPVDSQLTNEGTWYEHYRQILFCVCVGFIIVIFIMITIILIKVFDQPSRPQLHHAYFYLKTRGYTELDGATNLNWAKDESQNKGSIRLVNETYIFIPQDGLYQINCVVQLHIQKNTPLAIVTLMLQRKNNGKGYVFIKKSTNSLTVPEYSMIQLSVIYRLKANDAILLTMNKAKFISSNKLSSYLYINSLNIDND